MAEPSVTIANLADTLLAALHGDAASVDALFRCTRPDAAVPADLARLAEYIGLLFVQREVKEYQLDMLIGETLHLRRDLEQARLDPLTGLPNRALFEAALETERARANGRLALLYIDFDRFKSINDTYGHSVGDELLATGAARLKRCLEPGDTLGRIGGDEFVALLRDTGQARFETVAKAMLVAVAEPFPLAGAQIRISASIGIALCAAPTMSAATLVKNADVAMYQAKALGKSRYCLYRPPLAALLHSGDR